MKVVKKSSLAVFVLITVLVSVYFIRTNVYNEAQLFGGKGTLAVSKTNDGKKVKSRISCGDSSIEIIQKTTNCFSSCRNTATLTFIDTNGTVKTTFYPLDDIKLAQGKFSDTPISIINDFNIASENSAVASSQFRDFKYNSVRKHTVDMYIDPNDFSKKQYENLAVCIDKNINDFKLLFPNFKRLLYADHIPIVKDYFCGAHDSWSGRSVQRVFEVDYVTDEKLIKDFKLVVKGREIGKKSLGIVFGAGSAQGYINKNNQLVYREDGSTSGLAGFKSTIQNCQDTDGNSLLDVYPLADYVVDFRKKIQ
jgi:hypothetical protein